MAPEKVQIKKGAPKSALILDDDEIFLKTMEIYTKKLGLESTKTFEIADKVWNDLRENSYDILFLDWKLPGHVSGLALFNRIRRRTALTLTPILIVSGFVEADDFRLLKEFFCVDLLEKPFSFSQLEAKTKRLWQEYQWYLVHLAKIQKVFQISEKNPKKSLKALDGLIKKAPHPGPMALLCARFFEDHGHRDQAKDLYLRVLQNEPENVPALNGVGKILFHEGQNKQALKLLHKANGLSPHNMQRICLTGQAALQGQDGQGAKEIFQKALEIDQDDVTARAGLVVANNAIEFFQSAHRSISSTQNFASLMNSIGIAKIKMGKHEQGIKQYGAALEFIDNDLDRARIMFNLGLGHLKGNAQKEALKWFERSARIAGPSFQKSAVYIDCIKSGKPFPHGKASELEDVDANPDELLKVTADVEFPAKEEGLSPQKRATDDIPTDTEQTQTEASDNSAEGDDEKAVEQQYEKAS